MKKEPVLDLDTKLKFPHVLVIDASAGSGKTETLAQRFIQFILSKKILKNDLAQILAMTFTNNAAREMKERVLAWLKAIALGVASRESRQITAIVSIPEDRITIDAQKMVDTIIDRYTDFQINTIDSFMNRILHASAIEIGMPMDNELTESYDALADMAISSMLMTLSQDLTQEEIARFLELLVLAADNKFPWDPASQMKKTFIGFLTEEGRVTEQIEFRDSWTEYVALCRQARGIFGNACQKGLKDNIRTPAQRAMQAEAIDIKELLGSFSDTFLWYTQRSATPEALAACGNLLELVRSMAEAYSASKYSHFGKIYGLFKKHLETARYKTETLHFNDVNKKLLNYLDVGNIPEIYYRLGEELHHFMLDEFQDTDIVQWKNILPLLYEAFAKGGTLFAVGDLKQAIFMFRKADYRIMRSLVSEIKHDSHYGESYLPESVRQNARIRPLVSNYRSGKVILDYVEGIFKRRLKELGILKQDLTGLTTYVQEPAGNAGYDTGKHAGKKPSAGYVRTIIAEKSDDNAEPEKDILLAILADVQKRYKLSDISILTRKNENVEQVVEWLTESKCDAASFSSLDIRKRKIIMELVYLLKFLDSPIDNLAFGTFVTGDMFQKACARAGLKLAHADVLDMILECPKSSYLYTWLRQDQQFARAWELLFDDLFRKIGYLPLYDLVSQVYRTFQVFKSFPKETGFLVKFLESINELEAKGLNNLRDFVNLVFAEDDNPMFHIVLPTYIDAVRVMTFHKAKGLGFDVVINLIYDTRPRTSSMLFSAEEGHIYPYYITQPFAGISKTLSDIYERSKEDQLIQILNMLYVANTRAKKELYNIVVKKKKGEKSQGKIGKSKPAPTAEPLVINLFEEYEAGNKDDVLPVLCPMPKLEVTLPEEVALPMTEDAETWNIARLRETQKGDLLHQVLALIKYAGDDLDAEIDNAVSRARAKIKEAFDKDEIKKTIKKFFDIPAVKSWFTKKEGRKVITETEIVDENGALFRVDRLVIDPETLIVIDFKTGMPIEKDRKQVIHYCDLLQRAYRGKKICGYLAYIDRSAVEEVVK